MELKGNVAVVTGGASGLGRATAERLIAQGATVVIADLPVSNGAQTAAELGNGTQFVAADVTNQDEINAVLDAAQELGTLRAVVHCAGRW